MEETREFYRSRTDTCLHRIEVCLLSKSWHICIKNIIYAMYFTFDSQRDYRPFTVKININTARINTYCRIMRITCVHY